MLLAIIASVAHKKNSRFMVCVHVWVHVVFVCSCVRFDLAYMKTFFPVIALLTPPKKNLAESPFSI